MIIITFTALSILDDGSHEPEEFYRLHSTCTGNVTFKVLLSRLPALAHEAQTPVPQTRVAWTWQSKGRLYQCQKTLCIVLCGSLPAVSSRATVSGVCFLLLVLRYPQIQQTDVCTQGPNTFFPRSLMQAFFPGLDCLSEPLKNSLLPLGSCRLRHRFHVLVFPSCFPSHMVADRQHDVYLPSSLAEQLGASDSALWRACSIPYLLLLQRGTGSCARGVLGKENNQKTIKSSKLLNMWHDSFISILSQ